jgi:ribosomal protein L30/L7E
MIRLRATVTDKTSACLQGLGLDRIRWTPVRQKCTN